MIAESEESHSGSVYTKIRPNSQSYTESAVSYGKNSLTAVFNGGIHFIFPNFKLNVKWWWIWFGIISSTSSGVYFVVSLYKYFGDQSHIDEFKPPSMNPNYVARKKLTEKLQLKFEGYELGAEAVVACRGVGGAGKTEFVLDYVHRMYSGKAIWFIAENPELLKKSILTFLDSKGYIKGNSEKKIKEGFAHWREDNPNMICVFDNIESYESVKIWLNQSLKKQAKILITTRDLVFKDKNASIPWVDVDKMEPAEATTLLEKYSKRSITKGSVAEKLLEELGYLPLVIVPVGNYIDRHNYSYETFFTEVYLKNKEKILREIINERYPTSAWIIISLYWDQLPEEPKQLWRYSSCLAPNKVPRNLLQKIMCVTSLDEAIETLVRSGLMQPDGDDHYKMHRIFRDIVQLKIESDRKYKHTFEDLTKDILRVVMPESKPSQLEYGAVRELLPHIDSLLDLCDRNLINKNETEIYKNLLCLYRVLHRYNYNTASRWQDRESVNSVISGVKTAMIGLKCGGFIANQTVKQIINNVEELADNKSEPFSKESFRANAEIDWFKMTFKEIKILIEMMSLADNIISKQPPGFISDRQLTIFKLTLPYGFEHSYDELVSLRKTKEDYKEKLIKIHGFSEKSELVILTTESLGCIYRELASYTQVLDEQIELLEQSKAMIETCIRDMKHYQVTDDYPLYLMCKLDLATTLNKLACAYLKKDMSDKKMGELESDRYTTLMRQSSALYEPAIDLFSKFIGVDIADRNEIVIEYKRLNANKPRSISMVHDVSFSPSM